MGQTDRPESAEIETSGTAPEPSPTAPVADANAISGRWAAAVDFVHHWGHRIVLAVSVAVLAVLAYEAVVRGLGGPESGPPDPGGSTTEDGDRAIGSASVLTAAARPVNARSIA